jgi:hypothetical protein
MDQLNRILEKVKTGTIDVDDAQKRMLWLFGVSNPLPDDVVMYDNCLRIKNILDNVKGDFTLDINSFLIGCNWIKDYVRGEEE